MSQVNVDGQYLQLWITNIGNTIKVVESTKNNLLRKHQTIGESWKDVKYKELSSVVNECDKALRDVMISLIYGQKALTNLYKSIEEYEREDFGNGSSGANAINENTHTPMASGGGENTSLRIVPSIDMITEWISDINPNFDGDPFSPYSNNCGSCALAVFRRLSGDSNVVANARTLSIQEMNVATGRIQTTMSSSQIADYLISQGAGSFGVVGVDRSIGPGHWFNAYYDGQNIYALDGQTGEIRDWPPDYGLVTNWDISI